MNDTAVNKSWVVVVWFFCAEVFSRRCFLLNIVHSLYVGVAVRDSTAA